MSSNPVFSKKNKNHRAECLAKLVKQGDTESFVELLGLFSHSVSSLARSFSLPLSEHEDLCQEGRMALYRAAMSYDEAKGVRFSTYAMSCMTNAMITLVRKYNSENRGKVYSSSVEGYENERGVSKETPEDIFSANELEELLLAEGFAGLSAYERQVLSLKLSGLKAGEIAKRLSKPSKSIENTLFRARKKLKEYIDR